MSIMDHILFSEQKHSCFYNFPAQLMRGKDTGVIYRPYTGGGGEQLKATIQINEALLNDGQIFAKEEFLLFV